MDRAYEKKLIREDKRYRIVEKALKLAEENFGRNPEGSMAAISIAEVEALLIISDKLERLIECFRN